MQEREEDKKYIEVPIEFKRAKKQNEIGNCEFEKQMGMILWNGDLTICNSDPFGDNVVGNIFKEGVRLWNSERFNDIRASGGSRLLNSCQNCGYGDSYSQKINLK